MSDPMSSLREIVYNGPSREGWAELCAFLDAWECPPALYPIASSFLWEHLGTWSDVLRVPPQSWRQRLFSERSPPLWWDLVVAYDVWFSVRPQIVPTLLVLREHAGEDTYLFSLQKTRHALESLPACVVCAVGAGVARRLHEDLRERNVHAELRAHDRAHIQNPKRKWLCTIEVSEGLSQDQRNFMRHALKPMRNLGYFTALQGPRYNPMQAEDLFWAQDSIYLSLEDSRETIVSVLEELRAYNIAMDVNVDSFGLIS